MNIHHRSKFSLRNQEKQKKKIENEKKQKYEVYIIFKYRKIRKKEMKIIICQNVRFFSQGNRKFQIRNFKDKIMMKMYSEIF